MEGDLPWDSLHTDKVGEILFTLNINFRTLCAAHPLPGIMTLHSSVKCLRINIGSGWLLMEKVKCGLILQQHNLSALSLSPIPVVSDSMRPHYSQAPGHCNIQVTTVYLLQASSGTHLSTRSKGTK